MTATHLSSAGAGMIVGLCVLAAGAAIERPRLPLHLIPGSRVTLALAAPAAGIFAGWVTLRAAGSATSLGQLFPSFLGALLIVALSWWIKVRIEQRLRARVVVVGPVAFARDLVEEFEAAGIGTSGGGGAVEMAAGTPATCRGSATSR